MSEVVNIPQLRFPEFETDWEKEKLKNVSTYFNGGSFENDVQVEGRYELVTLKSINMSGSLVHSKRFIEIEVSTLSKNTLVMILSEQSPGLLGMTALIPIDNKYVLNQRVAEIRPNDNVDSYFLSMSINRNQRYFGKHGAGTKVQNLSKPNVENYEFLCPTKPEQQKIAAFLTAVDNKIEQLSKKQELLGEYKKGLMQKIFSQAIRFKADDGSEFPDWEEKKLGDLIAEISDGGTPPTSNKGNFGGGINWVVIDDIRDEIRITKETLTETGLSNSSSKLWKPETIILSTGATIGRVGIAKIYTTTKQGVCGIVVNQFTSNLFLKYWFIFNINLLKRFSQGSSIKEVRPPTLIKFDISTPSLPEQTKIANFLSSIDSKIEQVGKQLDESKQFKKALLQQMFV